MFLLVNAAAGNADRERVEAARKRLASRHHVEVAETTSPAEVDGVVAGLEADLLVVCGGDGSLHLAVSRLRDAGRLGDVVLGVVPLGTGNDLATSLGVPADPVAAADVVLGAAPRQLDLIVADDGAVGVNALHAGVGVDAALRAADLKERMGPVAYPLGAMAAGAVTDGWQLAVTVDGDPVGSSGESVLLVAVMNGPTFGSGTQVAPDAVPDDGFLDVVVATATTPAQRAAFGVALQAGRHLARDDVAVARGTVIDIRGDPVGYNIDGELEDRERSERTLRVEPSTWRLLVPADG